MASILKNVSSDDLRQLAEAIRGGRIAVPVTAISLARFCSTPSPEQLAGVLERLLTEGWSPSHLAVMLDEIADAQAARRPLEETLDLVWTGPEVPGACSRDTAVVVRELFGRARESVLIAGFVVYDGREVFKVLGERMEELPNLRVRMCLNIERKHRDTTVPSDLVKEFACKFKTEHWPGARLPEIYYYRRSLEMDSRKSACLHAKCIVLDNTAAFVSSANFTEAAQERNIEAGVLIRSKYFASQLAGHFEALMNAGELVRVFDI